MTAAPPTVPNSSAWNLANRITMARILLSLAVFVALHLEAYTWALVLFLITVSTDWLDGYVARRWNMITQFGRVADPLADKLVVCGTFVFLAAAHDSLISPWMAVVVLARELVVTVIRGFLELHGVDFSAQMVGKWKMVFQCAAALTSMWILARYSHGLEVVRWMTTATSVTIWLAVAITIYSGVIYGWSTRKLFAKLEEDSAR